MIYAQRVVQKQAREMPACYAQVCGSVVLLRCVSARKGKRYGSRRARACARAAKRRVRVRAQRVVRRSRFMRRSERDRLLTDSIDAARIDTVNTLLTPMIADAATLLPAAVALFDVSPPCFFFAAADITPFSPLLMPLRRSRSYCCRHFSPLLFFHATRFGYALLATPFDALRCFFDRSHHTEQADYFSDCCRPQCFLFMPRCHFRFFS